MNTGSHSKELRSLRRWWVMHFRTRVYPAPLVEGWCVERPDWWTWRGGLSAVTDSTVEIARARLDAWQDEKASRA